jgi:ribosome-binding factor A
MLNAEVNSEFTSAFSTQHSALQMSSQRPTRVGEQIREDLTELLARQVHDPGIGFLTITRVQVTSDLQIARIYYTTIGDAQARKETSRALGRATPFLRRQLGSRLRLRRIPEIQFFYDENIERLDRVERILHDLAAERAERAGLETERAETAADDQDAPAPNASTHNEQDDDR